MTRNRDRSPWERKGKRIAPSRAQYTHGRKIERTADAVKAILAGKHLFVGAKCQNAGWMRSQQLATLDAAVRHGLVFEAITKQEADRRIARNLAEVAKGAKR